MSSNKILLVIAFVLALTAAIISAYTSGFTVMTFFTGSFAFYVLSKLIP